MNKKLTLLLDESVISQAKKYAERHKETLSGMVEKYFKYVTSKSEGTKEKKRMLPLEIEEFIGFISIPEKVDIKREYRKHRAGKTLNE